MAAPQRATSRAVAGWTLFMLFMVNVFNVGLEGMMLIGAFCGFAASDATGSALIGMAAGAGGGLLLGTVAAAADLG